MQKQEIILYKDKADSDTVTTHGSAVQPLQRHEFNLDKTRKALTVIIVLMLFFALRPHGYNYYVMLRYAVFVAAVWNSFHANALAKPVWTWLLLGMAILFNPFLPIHLSKHTWSGIDLCTSCFLFVSLFAVKDR